MADRPRRRAERNGFLRFLDGLWPGSGAARVRLMPGFEAQLRENERIWERFRALELRMLAAGSLAEVLAVVTRDLPAAFPAVDAVTVAWRDPEYELSRLLEQEGIEPAVAGFLAVNEPEAPEAAASRPRLGALDAETRRRLFPANETRALASVAIAPLMLRGEHFGSLNQASADPRHYTPDAATDLLEHLAAVLAICIDNAVNRARLKRDGLTDALTGIANRRFFERRLQDTLRQWQRDGGSLSCLLVDLDHFKQINDRHGHQAGDLALQHVARLLSEGLRASDVLARYGGEEFVLLLPVTDAVRAREIAERLRSRIAGEALALRPGPVVRLTVSIGVASVGRGAGGNADDPGHGLMQAADRALYAAKARGRDRVGVAGEDEAGRGG